MAPLPFSTYPRRIVPTADGRTALVSIRRNAELITSTLYLGALLNAVRLAAARARSDIGWCVEVFDGMEHDPGGQPNAPADRVLETDDEATAATVAERVCRDLAAGGLAAVPGIPPSKGWIDDKIRGR